MRVRGLPIRILLAFFLLSVRPGRAQSPPVAVAPTEGEAVTGDEFNLAVAPAMADEIAGHIRALASSSYVEREAASAALIEFGPAAFRQLREAYHTSDDLEVHLRIESIVQEAYLEYHVFRRIPFLGVERKANLLTHELDPRIGPGLVGIGLARVLKGTGADQAGLQADDVIIAVDDEPLEGGLVRGFEEFAAAIREREVGAALTLTVLRGASERRVPATLGPCPKSTLFNVPGGRDLYLRSRQDFRVWWVRYFRHPPSSSSRPDGPNR